MINILPHYWSLSELMHGLGSRSLYFPKHIFSSESLVPSSALAKLTKQFVSLHWEFLK